MQKTHAQSATILYHLTGIKAVLDSFILSCRVDGLSPSTIKNYQYIIGKFTFSCWESGLYEAGEVRADNVRLFFLKMQETNNPTSMSDYHKAVRRFFNWLVAEGFIEKNPMTTIRAPRKEYKVVQPFTQQDVNNILAVCSGPRFLDIRNTAMVLVFLDTGIRLSENAALNTFDVDFNHESVKIHGKGAKERYVRIGKATQKALLKYLLTRRNVTDVALWLSEEFRPLTKDGIQSTVKALCSRAGVENVKKGPHTFRHTFAINFLRNGGDVFSLQIILGHSTLAMTRRYVSSLGTEDAFKSHKKASPVDRMFDSR